MALIPKQRVHDGIYWAILVSTLEVQVPTGSDSWEELRHATILKLIEYGVYKESVTSKPTFCLLQDGCRSHRCKWGSENGGGLLEVLQLCRLYVTCSGRFSVTHAMRPTNLPTSFKYPNIQYPSRSFDSLGAFRNETVSISCLCLKPLQCRRHAHGSFKKAGPPKKDPKE